MKSSYSVITSIICSYWPLGLLRNRLFIDMFWLVSFNPIMPCTHILLRRAIYSQPSIHQWDWPIINHDNYSVPTPSVQRYRTNLCDSPSSTNTYPSSGLVPHMCYDWPIETGRVRVWRPHQLNEWDLSRRDWTCKAHATRKVGYIRYPASSCFRLNV
jgi:hypothetical protein